MQQSNPNAPLQTLDPSSMGPSDPRSNRTVLTLLDVAERLFAERGVNQVSLREIVRESGQRNPSAARYHFGSREALIVAVVERRMNAINQRRHQLLDGLERRRNDHDLRAVVHASVAAVADSVRDTPWGGRYVQIVAELAQWPTDALETQVDPVHMSSMGRVEDLVLRCLPGLPKALLQRRMLMMRGYTAYTLSGWIRLNGAVTTLNARSFRQQVDTLADFLSAGLSGPATGITRSSRGSAAGPPDGTIAGGSAAPGADPPDDLTPVAPAAAA